MIMRISCSLFFFFNDTATTEIYTLSLHDALPIFPCGLDLQCFPEVSRPKPRSIQSSYSNVFLPRSEEHTSELQSLAYLVCRLLLEKKKSLASEGQAFWACLRRKVWTTRSSEGTS